MTITDERKQTMDFSVPYINAGQILVVKSEVSGVELLTWGKTVGAQIGTTGAFEIDKVKARADHAQDLRRDRPGLRGPRQWPHRRGGLRHPRGRPVRPSERQLQGQAQDRRPALHRGVLRRGGEEGQRKVLDAINKGLEKVLDAGENKAIEAKWLK